MVPEMIETSAHSTHMTHAAIEPYMANIRRELLINIFNLLLILVHYLELGTLDKFDISRFTVLFPVTFFCLVLYSILCKQWY